MLAITIYTLLPLLLPSTLAAPAGTRRAAPLRPRDTTQIFDGAQVGGKTYDYVIAGGGLTGMVLASRLSEDSGRTVLVLESGYDEEGNGNVTDTSKYQSAFDTFLDWAYQTVPQTSANSQPQTLRSGRGLGGSTLINGMAWSKPHDFQIDAMETVGNTGLNWNSLQQYMLRAEDFQAPSSNQYTSGVTFDPSCHASGGSIHIQYDPNSTPNQLEHDFNSTGLQLGLPYAFDLTCGNPAGLAPISNTRNGNTRVDAYRGYLLGKSRPNLTILAGANVGRVTLSSDSTPRATGLEFRDQNNVPYTVSARLEVIMATGSIKTPVILQQSGIGPAAVLSAAGVTQRVDLPIGMNLIDQTTTTTDWNFRATRGGGQPITFPRFQDMFKADDATMMQNLLQNNLASYAQDAVSAGASSNAAGLQQILEIQRDWILNQNVGMSENFDYSYDNTLGYDSWYLLPFGRGSIKITSSDAYSSSFNIDPRYLSNDFDLLAQAGTARFTRTVSQSSPVARDVTGESAPGGSVGDNSLTSWGNWVKDHYRSNWHPIGTVAMMSQDMGGSVDPRNRLYGVNGLRVVDASTLPFQVSSHLMSVLYGLSERAADLIKADNSGPSPSSTSSVSASSTSSSSASRTSSASSTSSTAPPAPTGTAIHPNGDTTKCVEVQDGNNADGTAVQINDCNNSPRQRWTFNRATTTVQLAGTNFCLDAGSTPSNGVKAKIWTCYSNTPAQTWYYTDDNYLAVKDHGQCLDLTDGIKTDGNVLQTYSCQSNNPNQMWTT